MLFNRQSYVEITSQKAGTTHFDFHTLALYCSRTKCPIKLQVLARGLRPKSFVSVPIAYYTTRLFYLWKFIRG